MERLDNCGLLLAAAVDVDPFVPFVAVDVFVVVESRNAASATSLSSCKESFLAAGGVGTVNDVPRVNPGGPIEVLDVVFVFPIDVEKPEEIRAEPEPDPEMDADPNPEEVEGTLNESDCDVTPLIRVEFIDLAPASLFVTDR